MSSAKRNILDIKKAAASRAKAHEEMRPLSAQKPPRLRTRRRNRRIIVGCICLLSTLGMIGGLGLASHLEQLAIKDVSVTGTNALPPEALSASVLAGLDEDRFRLFSRENMFLYPKKALEKALAAEFPRIKEVSISRPSLLAQAVVVAVDERDAYAKWCNDSCYLMDESGYVFAEAGSATPETKHMFYGGLATDRSPVGQWFLRGRLHDIVAFLERLSGTGYPAASLTVENEKDFTVMFENGTALYVPFDADTDTMMNNLATALEADSLKARLGELQYIDLRFGNRVYYK